MRNMPHERGIQPKRASTDRHLLLTALLVSLGLVCPLLVFLSLPLTFLESYDGITEVTRRLTGWYLLGGGSREMVLLATLILPIFPYLSCLLLFRVKSMWKEALLVTSFSLNCLLNMVGFALTFALTSGWNDLYVTSKIEAADRIPPVAFLLSFLCSCILLGFSEHRRQEKKLLMRK